MNEQGYAFIEPFKHCDKCDEHGFIIGSDRAEKCNCWLEYRKKLILIDSMLKANIIFPESSKSEFDRLVSYDIKDYRGKDSEGNIPKLEKFISKFDDKFNYINLYFFGTQGTQKTTIAKWIIMSLLKQGKTAYYIMAKDLIDIIMQAERDEVKVELLNRILSVDLLVLEEFEEEKLALYASGYKQKVLTPFLKTRLESVRKSTIFISNSPVTDLGKALEGTIADVIQRETLYGRFTFTDRYVDYMDKIDLASIWQ